MAINELIMAVGGPAFPSKSNDVSYFGASMREYLAMNSPVTISDAMIALGMSASSLGMLDEEDRKAVFAVLAKMNAEYADAMLSEHSK